jgi:hypothetical protein
MAYTIMYSPSVPRYKLDKIVPGISIRYKFTPPIGNFLKKIERNSRMHP